MGLGLNRKQLAWFYLIGLGLLVLLATQAFAINMPLELDVLDVGQGDATLIQTPEHHQILVDAGAGAKTSDQMGLAMGLLDKTIDLFVLSHPDRDHFAGIMNILNKYQVGSILMSGVISEDSLYEEFLALAKAQNIPIRYADNEQDLEISPGVFLDILYPLSDSGFAGRVVEDKNDTSVVVRLVRRGPNGPESLALLTGDAGIAEEQKLLESGEDIKADILKLGHHGSKFSSSDNFLVATAPTTAVISVGTNNRYGHPNSEILEKIKNMEIRRTDLNGNIVFKF